MYRDIIIQVRYEIPEDREVIITPEEECKQIVIDDIYDLFADDEGFVGLNVEVTDTGATKKKKGKKK